MRLITSNENKSDQPKRHTCDECGAELEYDAADAHIGWMGVEYVTCPNCNKETMVNDKRIQAPIWKATFYRTSVTEGAIDIPDHEVQVYIDKVVKNLCSDKWEIGQFSMAFTGNLLVFGVKWEDGIDIYVTKDYWEDNLFPEDYE